MRAASILGGLLLVSGCSGDCRGGRAPQRTEVLILGSMREPTTLDPAFARGAGTQEVVRLLFRDLTEWTPDWKLAPVLAAEIPTATTSTSGAIVTWRLRPGMKWSDGHPLTADDVVFGHEIESDPDLEAKNFATASQVAKVTKDSPEAFRAVWSKAHGRYDWPRVHAVLPAHAYPKPNQGSSFGGLTEGVPSSGPFMVQRWRKGQDLTLVPNPHWAGAQPKLEKIVFRFFKSEDAFDNELTTGAIDGIGEAGGLSQARADRLAPRLAETHVVTFRASGLWLLLNVRLDDPLLQHQAARRAVSKALDRPQLSRVTYGGHARPARGAFPPLHSVYAAAAPDDSGFNPREAKELLESVDPKISRRISLLYTSESENSVRLATVIKASLERVGFGVALDARPFATVTARLRERRAASLTLLAWRTAPDWDAFSVLHSKGHLNYAGFSDAAIDAELEASRRLSGAAWTASMRRVDARFRDQLPVIPLLFPDSTSIRPRGLEGWKPTGTTTPVTWNAERWTLDGGG